MLEFKTVEIENPLKLNFILGMSHFIKTVEDVYETLVSAVPQIKFGLAFNEASGECKVRCEGNDASLKELAFRNAMSLGCGHCFIIFLNDAYPINVLNSIKNLPEVCNIFCATANPVEVVIAQTSGGRGIMGVIDGQPPKGLENDSDIAWRKNFLRKTGYKL